MIRWTTWIAQLVWPGGAGRDAGADRGPCGAVLPGFGSRVDHDLAPAGVVAGRDVNDWMPFDPTVKSPTDVGA